MMKLVTITVKGIYGRPGSLLPASMARLTPDAAASLAQVEAEIESLGGCFRLSDAYRSSAMQARAHDDYIKGRKKAYSPPAGSSMHEAGRAIDLDLAALIHPPSVPKGSQTLNELKVRAIFESLGWTFIAPAGNPHSVDVKESWHIEFRGPFQAVYDNVLRRTGSRAKAYQSMAGAAIQGGEEHMGEGGRVKGEGKAVGGSDNGVSKVDLHVGDGEVDRADSGVVGIFGSGEQGESKEVLRGEVELSKAVEGKGAVVEATQGAVVEASNGAEVEASNGAEVGRSKGAEVGAVDGFLSGGHVGERLKSSTTFLQSMGIQMTAIGAAIWSFVSSNTGRLLYVLGGSAFVSLVAYAIYTWKEVQTKRIEAGRR